MSPSWLNYEIIKKAYFILTARTGGSEKSFIVRCLVFLRLKKSRSAKFVIPLSEHVFLAGSQLEQNAAIDELQVAFLKEWTLFRSAVEAKSVRLLDALAKRAGRAERRIYPPINLNLFQSLHTELYSELPRVTDVVNKKEWKSVSGLLDACLEKEKRFLEGGWTEIERHDKYRFDRWRYKFAKWGFIIAFVVFMFAQLPDAFKTAHRLWHCYVELDVCVSPEPHAASGSTK